MADYFYTVENCVDQTNTEVFSSTTLYSVGEVVSLLRPPIGCYTITEVSLIPGIVTVDFVSAYTTCLECIQTNEGVFEFENCANQLDTPTIDVLQFSIVPQFNQVYSILTSSGTLNCFTFLGYDSGGSATEGLVSIEGGYVDCNQCTVLSLPQSANTEVFVCEYICVTGGTGSSVVVVTPPHPQYSNTQGNSVTQLNMITLGGFNGLNS
jgi:hypothetical protein